MEGPRPITGAQAAMYKSGNRMARATEAQGPDDGRWPVSPDDWRERARAVLPEGAWGYLEGGAGGESTMRANREAFDRWRLRPRVLQGVASRDLSVDLFGRRLSTPVLLAPVGIQGVLHADADLASARAAAAAGVPFVASTVSSVTIEAIAAVAAGSAQWFQLYPSKSRELVRSLLGRAAAAGCEALVVTLDTSMLGWRERDLRTGYLPFLEGKGIANYLTDPVFRAMLARAPEEDMDGAIATFLSLFNDPAMTWPDLGYIREAWTGPLLLKGITHPEDALRALDHGADGVIVSNHGGRQVDGAVAALDALPAVAAAVAGRVPVLLDSGVRRGPDVLKAVALGARAVLIGRLFAYALAAHGEAGVRRVLDNLTTEIDVTLGLCGRRAMQDVDATLVMARP